MKHLDRYQSLLEGYAEGMYTGREVVGQVFDMLIDGTDRKALWNALSQEHRQEIAQYLQNYDEAAPPLLPNDYWQKTKDDTIGLKRWWEAAVAPRSN